MSENKRNEIRIVLLQCGRLEKSLGSHIIKCGIGSYQYWLTRDSHHIHSIFSLVLILGSILWVPLLYIMKNRAQKKQDDINNIYLQIKKYVPVQYGELFEILRTNCKSEVRSKIYDMHRKQFISTYYTVFLLDIGINTANYSRKFFCSGISYIVHSACGSQLLICLLSLGFLAPVVIIEIIYGYRKYKLNHHNESTRITGALLYIALRDKYIMEHYAEKVKNLTDHWCGKTMAILPCDRYLPLVREVCYQLSLLRRLGILRRYRWQYLEEKEQISGSIFYTIKTFLMALSKSIAVKTALFTISRAAVSFICVYALLFLVWLVLCCIRTYISYKLMMNNNKLLFMKMLLVSCDENIDVDRYIARFVNEKPHFYNLIKPGNIESRFIDAYDNADAKRKIFLLYKNLKHTLAIRKRKNNFFVGFLSQILGLGVIGADIIGYAVFLSANYSLYVCSTMSVVVGLIAVCTVIMVITSFLYEKYSTNYLALAHCRYCGCSWDDFCRFTDNAYVRYGDVYNRNHDLLCATGMKYNFNRMQKIDCIADAVFKISFTAAIITTYNLFFIPDISVFFAVCVNIAAFAVIISYAAIMLWNAYSLCDDLDIRINDNNTNVSRIIFESQTIPGEVPQTDITHLLLSGAATGKSAISV